MLLALKVIVAGHQVIEVAHLEGGVVEARRVSGYLHQEDAVMVGRLGPPVAAQESA